MNIFLSLEHATHVSWVIWSALFVGLLLVATGLLVRASLAAAGGGRYSALTADDAALVKRFAETRRRHPLATGEGLAAIAQQGNAQWCRRSGLHPFPARGCRRP